MAAPAGREPSTVWILGAGFSRALGAPLFKDLFRSTNRIFAAYGHSPPKEMIEVLAHYKRHAPEEFGGSGGVLGLFWRDPEEFLDVVESAHRGAASHAELLESDRGSNVSTETLVNMGRRALAIECSHFLRGADLKTERWVPYRRWASSLTNCDTVVTFNYDRVPELLSETRDDLPDSTLKVVLPNDPRQHFEDIRSLSGAPVLKLHGSVNWVATRDHRIEVVNPPKDDLPVTCANGSDLVLAVPGPGKGEIGSKYNAIGTLWAVAKMAIQRANRIVFVGYRFPPTDAQARIEILTHVKRSHDAGTLTKVQVILGPNENDQDVMRMKKLLGFVCPGKVDILPLYAEDFLAMPKEWRV